MIEIIYKHFKNSRGVSTDTREDLTGKIFFALKGENFNGNQFAGKAIEHGASMAIIDEEEFAVHDKMLLVKDSLKTLQLLASRYIKDLNIPIFAITGSNGKTTTKELISSILSTKYNLHATRGNFNNHIGVPLTILSCPENAEFLLVEMGANHLEEIQSLCEIAQPQYGAITNIGRAHLEGFGSVENVVQAKTELYRYLKDEMGLIIVNAEDEVLMSNIPHECRYLTYSNNGTLPDAKKYSITLVQSDPFLSLELEMENTIATIESNLIGGFNFQNLKLAIVIGLYFGVGPEAIKSGIEGYVPRNNRTEIRGLGSNTIVLDAYNANPSSMKASLDSFVNMGNKRIAILGDMKELGEYSKEEHAKIVDYASQLDIDHLFFVGPEFCKVIDEKSIPCYASMESLKSKLNFNDFEDTHFLIKGSRSMKLENLISE